MPLLTLTFPANVNISCAIGDTAYYVPTANSGQFPVGAHASIVEIGSITAVTFANNSITVDTALPAVNYPTATDFILFTKNNSASLSSLLGYFAQAKMVNTSTDYAELFQVSVGTFESSK
tara:strand:+ start:15924 stop:16283 length:360 start_codon:yes stop_codon:yes gene_type:complete